MCETLIFSDNNYIGISAFPFFIVFSNLEKKAFDKKEVEKDLKFRIMNG